MVTKARLTLVQIAAVFSAVVGAAVAFEAGYEDLDLSFRGTVSGSYQSVDVDGNLSKAFQYQSPPDGLYLSEFHLSGGAASGLEIFGLSVLGYDEDPQRVNLKLCLTEPAATIRYRFDRSRFFVEPTVADTTSSMRAERFFRTELIWPKSPVFVVFSDRRQQVREPGIERYGPAGEIDYDLHDQYLSATFPQPVDMDGTLRVAASRSNYQDFTTMNPDSVQDRLEVTYDLPLGSRFHGNTSVSRTFTDQAGPGNHSRIEVVRSDGFYVLRPDLTLHGTFESRDVRQPNTLSAYPRESVRGSLALDFYYTDALSFRGGYELRNVQRINQPQTFVDTPDLSQVWVEGRLDLKEQRKLSARYVRKRSNDLPPSDLTRGGTASMYYNKEDKWDLKLTTPLTRIVRGGFGYATYQDWLRENDDRGIEYAIQTFSTGAVASPSRGLSCNVDFSRQQYSGVTGVLSGTFVDENGLERVMLSDGLSTTIGAAYQLDKLTSVSANFSRFTSSGGLGTKDQWFSVRVNRTVSKDFEFGIELATEDYDDDVTGGLNFTDKRIGVDVTARF